MQRCNIAQVGHAPAGRGRASAGARTLDVSSAIGATLLAGTIVELAPHADAWPYHWEAGQEEWLVVLTGTLTVRLPGGEEELATGDIVCFPAGPDGAHALRNASQAPARALLISNRAAVNVIVHPDSGEIRTRTQCS